MSFVVPDACKRRFPQFRSDLTSAPPKLDADVRGASPQSSRSSESCDQRDAPFGLGDRTERLCSATMTSVGAELEVQLGPRDEEFVFIVAQVGRKDVDDGRRRQPG